MVDDENDELQAEAGDVPLARRRTTGEGGASKSRRTKSARLPLERVPKGQGTHDLTLTLDTTAQTIKDLASNIEEKGTLLEWNEPSLDAFDIFATQLDDGDLTHVTTSLRELLVARVSDGDMVQDLGMVVQRALAAHGQRMLELAA